MATGHTLMIERTNAGKLRDRLLTPRTDWQVRSLWTVAYPWFRSPDGAVHWTDWRMHNEKKTYYNIMSHMPKFAQVGMALFCSLLLVGDFCNFCKAQMRLVPLGDLFGCTIAHIFAVAIYVIYM